MLGDNQLQGFLQREASKDGARVCIVSCAFINLKGGLPNISLNPREQDPFTKELKGEIYIKYQPYLKKSIAMQFPYVIGCTMFDTKDRIRVANYQEVLRKIESPQTNNDYVLKWLFENTNLNNPDIFVLAKVNCYLRIYLSFDMLAYAQKINPNWETMPSYISEEFLNANADYIKDRLEGLREQDREYQRKKYKEAKRNANVEGIR